MCALVWEQGEHQGFWNNMFGGGSKSQIHQQGERGETVKECDSSTKKVRRDSELRVRELKQSQKAILLPTPREQGPETRSLPGAARGARPFLLLSEAAISQS